MPLSLRSTSLLLAALLGAAGVAVAAPQQQPHRGRAMAPPGNQDARPRRPAARPDFPPSAPQRHQQTKR